MPKVFNRDVRISGGGALYVNEIKVIDESGNIDAPVTTTDLTTTGNTTLGDAAADTLTINATVSSDVLVGTTKKVQFRDSAISVSSANDGYMDIAADTAVRVASPLVNVSSGATLAGLGTGANGFKLKNLKNAAASALSGTQLDIEIDIGGTPYYFTVYPTKA